MGRGEGSRNIRKPIHPDLLALFLAESGEMELTEVGIIEKILVEENDTGTESDPDTNSSSRLATIYFPED